MAVTPFQSEILKSLAKQRLAQGESYVAGGVALNQLLSASRRSRDIDLFHDTQAALFRSWSADRDLLRELGMEVIVLREAASFVEAIIQRDGERTVMQWTQDSAFRFFPLIQDDLMGLALHPFDLATNKVLAMAGRLEVRDWVDVLHCDAQLQPFGYLVWAACGKDPGFNPRSLLSAARRLHYSQVELDALDFEGKRPDAATLGKDWHAAMDKADALCGILPFHQAGACVISTQGELFRGDASELITALASGGVGFHRGRIGGAWPQCVRASSDD